MRRLLGTSALLGLFVPGLVALPTVAPAAPPAPRPVAPSVRTVDVPQAAPTAPRTGPTAALAVTATRFDTVGASWDAGATGTVEVRTRSAGAWTTWQALEVTDAGPDAGSTDATTASARQVSAPLFAGRSDGVQARAVGGRVPGLRLTLVDAGTSPADADPAGTAGGPGTASAAAAQPAVYTRAQWGADESLRSRNGSGCTTPDYSSTIKVAFVHHTDTPNGYSSAQVPSILRGIYAYHVQSNGWCDIGYNFLVDRFGRVWEGRYGGITRPVVGAHTGGFNADSFGTSLIGTYTDTTPSTAMQSALSRLIAWKLGLHHADPVGKATLVSAGGGTDKWPKGQNVTFNVIAGHRDAGSTTCPGNGAYGRLPALRSAARTAMGSALLYPAASARTAPYAGSPVVVTARVPQTQSWRLDVVRSSDLAVVRTLTGTATSSLSASVDLKDRAGAWLPPGGYTLSLTSAAGADAAEPWSAPFDVTTTATSPAPATSVGPPPATTFTPITPVRVLDTRTGLGSDAGAGPIPAQGRVEAQVLGRGGVPASGVAGVVVNLTGVGHSGATFLTAYPAENPWPKTSSVNLAAEQVHAGLVTVGLGAAGRLSVYNGSSTADAVVDVVGYFTATGGSSAAAVTPTRLVDTRVTKTPFHNGDVRSFVVAGRAGVPADATAVVANVTVANTASKGLLAVFPQGSTRPSTSTLNFQAHEVTSNRVFAGLSGGRLSVYAQATQVDVVLDVVGYFSPAATGTRFTPLPPARVLDTRTAVGVSTRTPVAGGSTTVVPVAGRAGVPTRATSVVVTLTTTGITHQGYVTGWSGVGARPAVSDVNTWTGHTVANLAVLALSPSGTVSLYNAGGSAHLVADVLGYFAPPVG